MDSLITFAKENFDLITLLVGMVGVFIAFLSLVVELKKRRREKEKADDKSDDKSDDKADDKADDKSDDKADDKENV
ncbi:MAG: hypothetical protein K6C30_04140 [Bacteroidaceae bacterium]|nr:hypothetical protein [Bacteroidaceae bacterium]